jgi:Sulfatase-modifying factor enzyme 1
MQTRHETLFASAMFFVVAACHSSTGPAQQTLRAPPDAVPTKVSVRSARVTTGAAIGALRGEATLSPYSIAKTPITVRQYRQCVAAGACKPPTIKTGACVATHGSNDGATYAITSGTEDRPVTCVSDLEAEAYCHWVGGRLPSVPEWTLAARGPAMRRYPWGDTRATCKQRAAIFNGAINCCGLKCDSDEAVRVGGHPAGDSELGVSDVLLTSAELMGADTSSTAPGCGPPASACIATGIQPGSIDFFLPGSAATNPTASRALVTSFRCAWEGGAR